MGIMSSIISGTSQVSATAATNAANAQIAQMNNEFNERMLQKQMDYNTEMYNTQLQDTLTYSDPSYIRSRLESAGYNAAVLASGTVGNYSGATAPTAQGINPPTASQYHADYSAIGNAVAQAMQIYNDYENSKTNRELTDAQRNQVQIENQYRAQKLVSEISKNIAEAKTENERAAQLKILNKFQETIQQQEVDLRNREIQQRDQQIQGMVMQNMMTSIQLQNYPEMVRLDLANQAADLAVKYANKQLTEVQINHEVQKIAETVARTGLIGEQTNTQAQQTISMEVQNRYDKETFHTRVKTLKAALLRAINESGGQGPLGEARRLKDSALGYHKALYPSVYDDNY